MRKELGGMTNCHTGIRRLLAHKGLTGSKKMSVSGVEEEDKNKQLKVLPSDILCCTR